MDRIRSAGVVGDIVPWRDVLHEGPVPAGLSLAELRAVRSRFIAAQGWGRYDEVASDFARRDEALAGFRAHDEVVLWFEHDLYDQLQLLQVLAWLACQSRAGTRVTLISTREYLGMLSRDRLRRLYDTRPDATEEQFALARRAWEAFRAPDPSGIAELARERPRALPDLAQALRRHLEQFPSTRNGLSRSEAQALGVIARRRTSLRNVFLAAHHEQEEQIFLGDTVFASYLRRLSVAPVPLVLLESGEPVIPPGRDQDGSGFWASSAVITAAGREVLAGHMDHVRLNGIDRWLGGVHLHGDAPLWRWNDEAGELQRTPA